MDLVKTVGVYGLDSPQILNQWQGFVNLEMEFHKSYRISLVAEQLALQTRQLLVESL
jgi:hypothetical protein